MSIGSLASLCFTSFASLKVEVFVGNLMMEIFTGAFHVLRLMFPWSIRLDGYVIVGMQPANREKAR
jgi:hypothetical protein